MSMREYAVSDYGMILDEETIKVIASKVYEDYSEGEEDDWGYVLSDEGICDYISEFIGEAQSLEDDGTFTWGDNYTNYNCDTIYYISLSHYPTLFKKAYESMDEVIDELKSKLGEYLSEDFDYRSRICHISGTYFG